MKRANIKAFFTVPFLSLISRFVTHFSTLLYGGFIRYTGLLQAASNLKPGCSGDFRGFKSPTTVRQCDSATVSNNNTRYTLFQFHKRRLFTR